MFSNNNSPFAGLVPVILVLVLIGALAALALSGSDLTNFMTNRVKAQALAQQNAISEQKASIDLKNYQALQDSQAQAQINKTVADSAAYQQSLIIQTQHQQQLATQNLQLAALKAAQEMQTTHLIKIILSIAGALAVLLIGMGLTFYLIQLGRSHLMAEKMAKKNDPWHDLSWRKQQIEISRRQEHLERINSVNTAPIPIEIPTQLGRYPTWEFREKQRPNRKEVNQ